MLKVGRTKSSAHARVMKQKTSMPEDPVLYYVFTAESTDRSLEVIERKFHDHLNAIGHRRSSDSGGGTEWFLTNFGTIVSTAELLSLSLEFELFGVEQ